MIVRLASKKAFLASISLGGVPLVSAISSASREESFSDWRSVGSKLDMQNLVAGRAGPTTAPETKAAPTFLDCLQLTPKLGPQDRLDYRGAHGELQRGFLARVHGRLCGTRDLGGDWDLIISIHL